MAHPVPLAMPETSSLVDSSVSKAEDGRVDGGGSIERCEFSRIAVFCLFLVFFLDDVQSVSPVEAPNQFCAKKHPPPRWCEKSKNQNLGINR